jgi:predicted RNA methylase
MPVHHCLIRFTTVLVLLLAAAGSFAQAQPAAKEYQPTPFQEGKDVVWLPTPQSVVDKMLDVAKVGANDFVIDLGSGDGRTVITAAKRGARAMGVEFNPNMVELSNRNAEKAGVAARVRLVQGDLFEADISQATVLTLYLLPAINVNLRPKILDLTPGTRVVSHAFDMAEWQADQTSSVEGKTVYLWIVPAKVAGTWKLQGGEISLTQNFQMLEGTLKTGDRSVPITNGRLRGDQISFSAGNAKYSGRVSGQSMEGTVAGSTSGKWSATLAPASSTQKEFEPHVGQQGKDVIWVPTPEALIEQMLNMAKVTADDFVMDLGAGDGRTVIAAAKRGARALGVEYNPDMVELSNRNAEKAGVTGKARFMKADLFETDLSQATVITMYLLPTINMKLRAKVLDLKPGTRVVSHAFDMNDWEPDETANVDGRRAYLWIVPAKVAGNWQLAQGELALQQKFQTIEGTLKYGERSVAIANGRLNGDQISFIAGDAEYSGRVGAGVIDGTVRSGGDTKKWSAKLRSASAAVH